jgi:hypothetical protein
VRQQKNDFDVRQGGKKHSYYSASDLQHLGLGRARKLRAWAGLGLYTLGLGFIHQARDLTK